MLGHKESLNKWRRLKSYWVFFSNYSARNQLQEETLKGHKNVEINNHMLPGNQCAKDGITREIRNTLRQIKWKYNQNLWDVENYFEEGYSQK